MKVDINDLSGYFAKINFSIVDIRRAVIEPGSKLFGITTSPFPGMIFPLRGRSRMSFDGVPYDMEPGKVFHGGPSMPLDKEVLGQSNWDYMVVHYQVHGNTRGTFPYALSHYELSPGYNPRINDTLHRMYHICKTPGNLPALKIKSLFFIILDEILTFVNCNDSRELVAEAAEYMKNYHMEPLTIPELARQYDLTSKQFAYLFQKHTGMSPNKFLIEYRMRRAKELLCTTTFSVAKIAEYVGYSDPYYFSLLFKKRMGLSPSTLQAFKKIKI
ncbi:helix-turn-helix domain-containing protein [Sporomusa termitida]|uniref:HTH-type transcriptional activator RhaS n=1 Tax=Sporomusa termitida TaxID=2377 RepID=A0A517DYD4_9FIRM|nr:AraC family transcriptional regulator [Sporomusa termitida]QDR82374.1 HTH-type transcriptional activator RhaS [Sporomusa termitida]